MLSPNRDVHAADVEHTAPAGQKVLGPVACQSAAGPNEEAPAIARDPDGGSMGPSRLASVRGEPHLSLTRCCFQGRLTELAHPTHQPRDGLVYSVWILKRLEITRSSGSARIRPPQRSPPYPR